jgi:hypothetical protein
VARAKLQCHPDSAGKAVRTIDVEVSRRANELEVSYLVTGDMARVRIPPPSAARRAERLWEHTCCELFVAESEGQGYVEFNFSPSTEWACYGFSKYRQAAAQAGREPAISVRGSAESLELRARVRVSSRRKLALGLSAVIEENYGTRSYWALRHPAGQPDFHHREAFALELDEVRD